MDRSLLFCTVGINTDYLVCRMCPAAILLNLPLRSIPSLASLEPPAHEAAGGYGSKGEAAGGSFT